jgi:diguanylate cyclase (GGDEF)-like protein
MSSLPVKRDFLTNCYTREGLGTIMNTMVEQFQTHGKPFSFFLIDIDHFKKYNDRFGHIHGDEALKYFSSTLRLYLQENECYPFRLGGDEFVVVFPRTTTQECFALAKKLEKALKKRPFIYKDKQMRVISFSGGIASYPADGETLEELLENSDKAMYSSKKRGRGRTTQYRSLPAIQITRFLIFALITTAAIGILIGAGAFLLDKETFKNNLESIQKKKTDFLIEI